MKKLETKQLVLMAMFAALAFIAVVLLRIPIMPAAPFLTYEAKDVVLTICGFIFGPVAGLLVTMVVSLIEMLTISATGWIGLIMNILSSASFGCIAAIVYKHKHTLKGAISGLVLGVVTMTGVMVLWNYLITPLYMGVPRNVVVTMLIPVFLPFNLLKGGINAAVTMLLYKPVVQALRMARMLPGSQNTQKKHAKVSVGVIAVSALVLVTCILLILVLQGKI